MNADHYRRKTQAELLALSKEELAELVLEDYRHTHYTTLAYRHFLQHLTQRPAASRPLETTMTERQRNFIDTYVATFLASRAAIHYEDWCAADEHNRLTVDQPIEDAVFQALETWALYVQETPPESPARA